MGQNHCINSLKERQFSSACQLDHFEYLKECLTFAPILAIPNWLQPFIIDTDANNVGISTMLSQVDQEEIEHVIANGSHVLSKAVHNYCGTLLLCDMQRASCCCHICTTFPAVPSQPTIYHPSQIMALLSGYKSLETLKANSWKGFKSTSNQFIVIHCPGNKCANADALLRLPCQQCGRASHYNIISIALLTTSHLLCAYSPDQLKIWNCRTVTLNKFWGGRRMGSNLLQAI